MPAQPLSILLAEDDDGHASLIQRNLRRAGVANDVVRVNDGQEALDYSLCEGAYTGRVPNGSLLLLLDINMPRLGGVEVLRRIRSDSTMQTIPVIMLTTTDDPREIERCYQLGCSVYVTKPVVYEEFIEAIKRLGLFLAILKVPSEGT